MRLHVDGESEADALGWATADQIRAGIAEAEAGRTVDLGDFTQFVGLDDEL